ncbi:urease accessory protein UreG [Nakamurella sp. GG22]
MPENPSPAVEPVATRQTLRLGVAGPVGTGKSSLIALICRELAGELSLGVITNDIYTDEDARFLRSAGVLAPERIRAVETGACPHTAIRDDVTANLLAVEDLEADFAPLDIVLVESGGDNLTATFSPALVDAQIFVLDVAGGGDVARKGGPGIGRADLLVVNKTDLGPYVGVDVPQMVADGKAARNGRPVIGLSRLDRASIDDLTSWVRSVLRLFRSGGHIAVDPGPMAPHSHADEGGAASVHRHGDGPLHTHEHKQHDHEHDEHEHNRAEHDRTPTTA